MHLGCKDFGPEVQGLGVQGSTSVEVILRALGLQEVQTFRALIRLAVSKFRKGLRDQGLSLFGHAEGEGSRPGLHQKIRSSELRVCMLLVLA